MHLLATLQHSPTRIVQMVVNLSHLESLRQIKKGASLAVKNFFLSSAINERRGVKIVLVTGEEFLCKMPTEIYTVSSARDKGQELEENGVKGMPQPKEKKDFDYILAHIVGII